MAEYICEIGEGLYSKKTGEYCFESKIVEKLIRCKDCKFTDGEKPIADGRYWCVMHQSFMYYCSDAERKEDEMPDLRW